MKASFVLVNYNRKDELMLTLSKTKECIKHAPDDFEILVVDNASTDGSAVAVKTNFPDVVLIENKVNTGAPAWNLGFAKAKGQYFIIIDDDSHIESGLVDALSYMDRKPDIGILALNVISGPYTSADWNLTDGQDVIGFIGCGAIFRRKVYNEIGGYADWIFLYANEWDLGFRTRSAGYRVEFFEGCKVVHRAARANRSSRRLVVLSLQHEMGIIYKYFGKNSWAHLFNIAVNSLKIIKNGKLKEIGYAVSGIIGFLRLRKSLTPTPVSADIQKLFLNTFSGTKPAFGFVIRNMRALVKKKSGKQITVTS
jgi:GT2 family glycosyltransferase